MANEINQPKTLLECITLQSHFVGIPKITKKSSNEFYRRGKTLQVLGVGFLEKGRMPTLEEIKEHEALETNAHRLDPKKWKNVLLSVIDDMTQKLIEQEKTLEAEVTPPVYDTKITDLTQEDAPEQKEISLDGGNK